MPATNLFSDITHIIFDLDGLLIDSEPLWQLAEEKILAQHGKQWDTGIAKQHIGLRIDESAAVMVKSYQIDVDANQLADHIFSQMQNLIQSSLVAMHGANEAIHVFQQAGFVQAIASSSAKSYIQTVVDKLNWASTITVMASAYDVPRGKPAPDVYLKAAELLQVQPQHCLALEDSLNGAKAAQAAGMRTIAIPGHDFLVSDFDGVAEATFPSLINIIEQLPH